MEMFKLSSGNKTKEGCLPYVHESNRLPAFTTLKKLSYARFIVCLTCWWLDRSGYPLPTQFFNVMTVLLISYNNFEQVSH